MSRNFDFSQAANKGITILPDAVTTPPVAGVLVSVASAAGGSVQLGFASAARINVTGAKGGNAALASLLAALVACGLITDNTTA